MKNATYAGLGEQLGPVTLTNGRWTGAPSEPGAASRPSVELAGDCRVVGDLDRDGREEAVVVLTYSSGGTGVLSFLAVVTREDVTLRNGVSVGGAVELERRLPASALDSWLLDLGDLLGWRVP